ncbi:MAG TPA: hypothetical protein ENK02_03280 [Planctomycetes bacterium]|nr:hypothetical protein [Planctomycetota bacterium]
MKKNGVFLRPLPPLLTPLLAAGLGLLSGLSAYAPKGTPTPQAQKRAQKRGGTPEERYQRYLQKDYIKKGGWVLDYDEARARARREGKLIFVYFSRSYAP